MKDEQKLKLLRLAINYASDLDEAKANASFILGDRALPVAHTTRTSNRYKRTKAIIEDGVYILSKGYQPVRSKDVIGVQDPKNVNVMVSYHGHKWIVAKKDISENEISLLKHDGNVKAGSPFYKSEIEALNDFNMESYTDHLRKSGLHFKLDDDLYIPTVGQLAAMYLYREELNRALRLVHGTPMKESLYWSSNEKGPWSSWLVYFDAGIASTWNGASGKAYVRPCRTFELKKK